MAPDGTGKTTLLSEWAHRLSDLDRRVVWLNGPALGEGEVDAVLATSGRDLVVFVDDAELAEPETVHRLASVASGIPHLFLVLASSRPLSIIPSRAELTMIHGRDLMLTAEETTQLGELLGVDPDRMLSLQAALGGWLGPLRTAAMSGVPLDHGEAEVVDSLVVGALRHSFSPAQLELLTSTIRDPAVSVPADLRRLLVRSGLSEQNPLTGERFDPLPVVREALVSMAGTPGSPTQRTLTAASAGGSPAESLLASLQSAVSAADWGSAETVWARGAEDLIEHRLNRTWQILSAAPAEVLADHALLAGAVETTRRALRGDRSLSTEGEAAPQSDEDPRDVRQLHVLARAIENAGREGRSRAAERDARHLQQGIANAGDALAPLTRARYLHVAGSALLSRAQTTVAPGLMALDRAYETANSGLSSAAASRVAIESALTLGFIGVFPEARIWAGRITERAGADDVGPALVDALLAVESGDYPGSQKILATVLEPSQYEWRYWAFAMWIAGRLSIAARAPLSGLALLQSASRRHMHHLQTSRLNRSLIDRALADCAISAAHGALATSIIEASDAPHIHAVPTARMQLLSGRFRAAVRTADMYEWHEDVLPRDRVELAGIRTDALFQLDKHEDAASSFRQMVEYAAVTTFVTPMGLLAGETIDWLRRESLWPDAELFAGIPRLDWYGVATGASPLSRRETIVIQRLARGMSNDEIARELTVSTNTVKSQLRSAYRKLRVSTRSDAILRARELGILLSA